MKKISILLLFSVLIFVPLVARADLVTDYNNQYNALEQQIIDVEAKYYEDVANIKQTAGFLAQANGLIQRAADEANEKIQQIQLQKQQLHLNYISALNVQRAQQLQEIQQHLQENQQPTCATNSYYSNGQCYCNEGYIASGNSCITYNQSCRNQYGVNSYGDKNNCYCDSGYQWNDAKTGCETIICPANASLAGSQCFCNDGYVQNGNDCITYTQDCVNTFGQSVYGIKGKDNNSSCFCKDGYEWNSSQTACIEIINCGLNSTKINDRCACNDGYKFNSSKIKCVKIKNENNSTDNYVPQINFDATSVVNNYTSQESSNEDWALYRLWNFIKNIFK